MDFQAAKASQSTVRNISFENIDILKAWRIAAELNGHSMESPIEGVQFTNLWIEGKLAASAEQAGLNLINTRNVTIQGNACPNAVVQPLVVKTQDQGPVAAVNLLQNPSFENDLEHWMAYNGTHCRLVIDRSTEDHGAKVAAVFDRGSSATGIQQDVTELLRKNGPGMYTYGARVRAKADHVSLKVTLRIEDSQGVQQHPSPDVKATADDWQETRRSQNLNWTDLTRAVLIVESGWGDVGAFYVDECWLSR